MSTRHWAILAAAGAVLALSLAAPAAVQDAGRASEPTRPITVHGEALVRVAPDEVQMSLGVEALDRDIEKARTHITERTTAVRAVVKQLGIEPKHFATEFLEIQPELCSDQYCRMPEHKHDGDRPRSREFVGFRARTSLCIILRDVSKFEDVLSGALKSGITQVHDVQFRTTKLKEHRVRARAMAVRAAREKAELLTKELGQKVGRPISIHEQEDSVHGWSGWGRRGRPDYGASQEAFQAPSEGGAEEEPGGLAVGSISVRARVVVSFEMKD
jgi:hypothetical protein